MSISRTTAAAVLRRVFSLQGRTTAQLAAIFGVAQPTVSQWQTGSRFPRVENLEAIAGFCDVTIEVRFSRAPEGEGMMLFVDNIDEPPPPLDDVARRALDEATRDLTIDQIKTLTLVARGFSGERPR